MEDYALIRVNNDGGVDGSHAPTSNTAVGPIEAGASLAFLQKNNTECFFDLIPAVS